MLTVTWKDMWMKNKHTKRSQVIGKMQITTRQHYTPIKRLWPRTLTTPKGNEAIEQQKYSRITIAAAHL